MSNIAITMDSTVEGNQNEMHQKIMSNIPWVEQIDYILDMEIQYDNENLNVYLIELYEQLNKRSYEFDKMRTNYAFAKCMNMDQAVNLYDSLTESGKYDLINVIKFDFPHLHDLARIHDTFEFESVDVITLTFQ